MNREKYEQALDEFLAPYACRKSKGRRIEKDEDVYRIAFQRDRDKILFSPSFRRLEYKTQVFVYRESDYFRTRLTHTLEVMQTSTELARFLRLNVDLVEAIALGHDLGHPPFGHAGERALASLMGEVGFRHNEQSLRIVDELENYGRFKNGLNLTWEVREGILKHTSKHMEFKNLGNYEEEFYKTNPNGTLEAQIVCISDDIVQVVHDIDDALRANDEGVLTSDEIKKICESVTFPEPYNKEFKKYKYARYTSWLLGPLMDDLVKGTFESIKNHTYEDILASEERFVKFSKLSSFFKELGDKLALIHNSSTVSLMDFKGQNIIKKLFNAFKENINLLPEEVKQKINGTNKERVICDFISSMTDRMAHETYDKMFLPYRE